MKDEFRRGPHRPEREPFSVEVEGTVSQSLPNPSGEVDGLLLEDHTVIKFPPHLARELVKVIKPKERVRANGHLEADGVVLDDGTLLHSPPHAGRQFAKLLREGEHIPGIGFGTVNDLGRSIAVAMLGRSTDALALGEPPPAKPKKHPEDRKVREEES